MQNIFKFLQIMLAQFQYVSKFIVIEIKELNINKIERNEKAFEKLNGEEKKK